MNVGLQIAQRKNPADLSFKLLVAYYYNTTRKQYNWVFPIETDNLRFGRKCSEQHKQATSKGRKGMKFSENHMRSLSTSHIGKRHPEEQKEKMRQAALRLWSNPEYYNRQIRAVVRGRIKPSRPELFLTSFLQETFPSEWKYVGNGEVVIARKNPDFININGQKKIIEFNGFYTHTKQEEIAREKLFLEYGFKTLFLHYPDLRDEEGLRQKIVKFVLEE